MRRVQVSEYDRNVILNFIFRGLTIFFSFAVVRYSVRYLGEINYGIWITISSVVSWMGACDFGIGNSLRNELAKAYAKGDSEREAVLIGSAVRSIWYVSVFFCGIILVIVEILLAIGILEKSLRFTIYISAVFFCTNLLLGVFQSICYGYQYSWLVSAAASAGSFAVLVSILIFIYVEVKQNIAVYAVIMGAGTLLSNVILLSWYIKKKNKKISELIRTYDKRCSLNLFKGGYLFAALQICAVVLYSTDSVIIKGLFEGEAVTKYTLITNVFDTGNNIFSILLIALWSATTFQLTNGNYRWIKSRIKKLIIIWGGYCIGVVVVMFLLNVIIRVWMGDNKFHYSSSIIMVFGVYTCVTTFSAIFGNVLNGAGKIGIQVLLATIEAIVNIPLSIYFACDCGMGIMGVKLATLFCVSIGIIIYPIQVIRLLKKDENKIPSHT